jgi:P27 family predicted phage terminase small subunit
MARTGRPPKPIEQKRRTGNPGQRKLPSNTLALVPADGVPPVPIDLKPAGRTMWSMVWGGPAAVWLSPQVDAIRVHTVARLLDEIEEYHKLVTGLGAVLEEPIVTPSGQVVADSARFVPNPAVRMLRDAQKQLDRELSSLGFDPTSRSRLGLAEVKRESILQRLLGADQGQDDDAIEADVVEILAD